MTTFQSSLARFGLVAVSLIAAHAAVAGTCDKTPIEPRSVQSFARDMIVNGVHTSLVGVEYAGTTKDVSDAFREFWIREDVAAKARSNGSGLQLSALDDRCLYVLNIPPQAQSDRTRGLMSVIRLGEDRTEHNIPDSAIPLPETGTVLSDVESRDPGQTGRTWILDIPGEAKWNAQRYRNALSMQGWVAIGRSPDLQVTNNRTTHQTAFAMQLGADSVDVSFTDRSSRTIAVINAIRNR